MRKLNQLNDVTAARELKALLTKRRIACELRRDPEGAYGVWIVAEEDVPAAQLVLQEFAMAAKQSARSSVRPASVSAKPSEHVQHQNPPLHFSELGRVLMKSPVTAVVLALCVVTAALTDFGARSDVARYFFIADWAHQPWRIVSPILLHFGVVHLAFNAIWMLVLGAKIERFQGPVAYAGLIVWTALLSNFIQLRLGGSSSFGGLSGVVYGLMGYLWARGHFDPESAIRVPPDALWGMLIWLVLGFVGALDQVVGRVANYCHLGGLLAGAAYGYAAARARSWNARPHRST